MSQSQSGGTSPHMEQLIKQGGAAVGGTPTVLVDVPICAVFIALYLTSAVSNITIFQRNRRRGHKFILSALLVGFSMARVLTCTLRIVWATRPTDISTAIAAQIFVNAGILIVYIINIIFAQRILRARRPEIGWNWPLRIAFRIMYALIGASLVLLIVVIVYSFYTLDPAIHSYAQWIQRGAILYLFIVAFCPLVFLALAFGLPQTSNEDFGKHSTRTKGLMLLAGACICTIISGFKVGTTWSDPRAKDNPAWYDSKAAFYCFNFVLEVILLSLYVAGRVDHKFHIPDGSSKRKSYRIQDGGISEDCTENSDSLSKKGSRAEGEAV